MSKEKVYIVLSHVNSLKPGSRTEWQVTERVEFVNQLRKKHNTMASVIGNYTDRKMVMGARYGMTDYDQFETYVRTKYKEQMDKIDSFYEAERAAAIAKTEVVTDQFGNIRTKTVFDAV